MNERHVGLISAVVCQPEGASLTEIHGALGRNWPKAEVEAILGVLIAEGRVRREERRLSPNGRRHGVYLAVQDRPAVEDWIQVAKSALPRRQRRPAKAGQQWIYFIQAVGGGRIKIGRAVDPDFRLGVFQLGCPVRLRIIGLIAGGVRLERGLHTQFADAWAHNEWFEPTADLLAYIAEHAKVLTVEGGEG